MWIFLSSILGVVIKNITLIATGSAKTVGPCKKCQARLGICGWAFCALDSQENILVESGGARQGHCASLEFYPISEGLKAVVQHQPLHITIYCDRLGMIEAINTKGLQVYALSKQQQAWRNLLLQHANKIPITAVHIHDRPEFATLYWECDTRAYKNMKELFLPHYPHKTVHEHYSKVPPPKYVPKTRVYPFISTSSGS